MTNKMKEEDMKKINQGWRRKPRKWAPKSKKGCKTCKIRRIKCDLSQPSCLKCSSTGRTCDGYVELHLALQNDKIASYDNRPSGNTETEHQPDRWRAKQCNLKLHNIAPLMIFPVTGPAQAEALCFFENTSIAHMNAYRPCESWRKTLMYFSQTVPSVRYAALAVASIHREYLDRDSSLGAPKHQYLKNWLLDKTPLFYYNRAIQLLLNQQSCDDTETIATTLLVCYLFICFDHLAGDDVQAMKHLSEGVKILRSLDKTILDNNYAYGDALPSGFSALISQITSQIRRLDMQAAQFLTVWNPNDIQRSFMSPLPISEIAFRSLDEAADHLQSLGTQVMRLRWGATINQQISTDAETLPPHPTLQEIVLSKLITWSHLFQNMLQQSNLHGTDSDSSAFISLMRLQHVICWILLHTCGRGREMDYDNFLPQFQHAVALASHVSAAHERYSESSTPTFTPEVGIVPVLYIIGAKCRHPSVRREVLSILRRQPIREAVWESISVARVVERLIEIEEGASCGKEGIQSMEQVPVWRRVEDVSWVNSASGRDAATMNLEYTFCDGAERHCEKLLI